MLLVSITAGLSDTAMAQTTPPVPNFSMDKYPALTFNVRPADFNRDGRTDLVAAMSTTTAWDPWSSVSLVVALGRGDGTFAPPRAVGVAAIPLTVGDLNADGFVDVIVKNGDSLEVVPGAAGGAFGAPRVIAPTTAFGIAYGGLRPWGYVVDLDGDGHRDVVADDSTGALKVYRGTAISPSRPGWSSSPGAA